MGATLGNYGLRTDCGDGARSSAEGGECKAEGEERVQEQEQEQVQVQVQRELLQAAMRGYKGKNGRHGRRESQQGDGAAGRQGSRAAGQQGGGLGGGRPG